MSNFQSRVRGWMHRCFGREVSHDKTERSFRFLEEALELVQACGVTRDEADELVSYVFGRKVGEPSQEVGGVCVTLAALCSARGIHMAHAAQNELYRCERNIERIRAKHLAKPIGVRTALPGLVERQAE